MIAYDPTEDIEVGFDEYVVVRERGLKAHLEGGVPDYAFSVDCMLRRKIRAVPGAFPFFKALTSTYVPRQKQYINMNGLRVGPGQYQKIHQMTEDCARILGIGMPSVFIVPEMATLNAYTIATDDESPIIVLHSSLVERFTPKELRTIIGHECGHIHNNHGIYTIGVQMVLEQSLSLPIIRQVAAALTLPLRMMFMAWSRAAEVTCDRAGMICAEDPADILQADVKLMQGGMMQMGRASVEAALKQFDMMRKTPVRLLELDSTHPATVRRLYANLEFMDSEVLYRWRPELKTPGRELIGKQELDARCAKYVGVLKNGEGVR